MYNCEFCNNKYKSISSLNHHKKTAKKCLILRDALDTAEFFECKKCEFKTTVKDTFNSHKCKKKDNISEYKLFVEEKIHKLEYELKLMVEKNKELTEKLDKQVEKHENQLFTLASKPTSVKIQNLTNILGNLEFKENTIKETVDNNYNIVYLNEGIKGLAQFTKDHIINAGEDGKKKYLCSDPARSIFKYKDENGVIQKDVKATKLKKAIQEPILNKTKSLLEYEILRVREEGKEEFDTTDPRIIDNIIQVKNLEDNGLDYAREMSLLC